MKKINNYYLSKTKEVLTNGKVLIYNLDANSEELNMIKKYILNNGYKIVSIDKLLTE